MDTQLAPSFHDADVPAEEELGIEVRQHLVRVRLAWELHVHGVAGFIVTDEPGLVPVVDVWKVLFQDFIRTEVRSPLLRTTRV